MHPIQFRSQIRDLVDQEGFPTGLYCSGRISDSRVVMLWNSFIQRISDIRFLTLTICLNLRLGCDFRLFGCGKCFCHQLLHLYSAPGIYQRMSDAKVTAECAHAFCSFHRLCFYIFLPLKINSINSEAPKTITRYPILFIFFICY